MATPQKQNSPDTSGSRKFLLTAAGPDQPGIVASVTKLLFDFGCNLEDSAMTQLRGEFAILLMFSVPAKASLSLLQGRLRSLGKKMKLSLQLKPLSSKEATASPIPAQLCLVTVYGADRAGIVYRIAEAMAKLKVNITDVTTHRTEAAPAERPDARPGYILYLEGELPKSTPLPKLEAALKEVGRELGVTAAVKPIEPSPL